MTVNDRIKHLRKNILKLSQEEFSEKLDISRSNLGGIETGRVGVTPRVISDICSSFGIRREWLETGDLADSDVFANTFESFIDDFCKKLNLNDFGKRALIAYLKLSEEEQDVLAKYAELIVSGEKSTNIVEMLSAARGSADNSRKIQTDLETASKLDTLPDKSHDFD